MMLPGMERFSSGIFMSTKLINYILLAVVTNSSYAENMYVHQLKGFVIFTKYTGHPLNQPPLVNQRGKSSSSVSSRPQNLPTLGTTWEGYLKIFISDEMILRECH